MVVYSYAAQHAEEVTTLAILDVPLPGMEPSNELIQGPALGIFVSIPCWTCRRCSLPVAS